MRGPPQPFGICPLGGAHAVRWWHDHRGVACYRCHQTWWWLLDELRAVWPPVEVLEVKP